MISGMDLLRRQIGFGFDTLGIGPSEAPYRVVAELPGASLRAYHGREASGPTLLIVPAPFKRPYIWDLAPKVSVTRHCLCRGFRVYLIEWRSPSARDDDFGLNEYASLTLDACVDAIEAETGSGAPILAGHSIGGTFAAIFAALHPQRVRGLVLVDAPLAFGERGGPLARAVALLPHARLIRLLSGGPVPGSLITALSVAAAPEPFQLQRQADLFACLFDPDALAIHARVARWTYDELPMPGRLFEELVEQLYRRDCFAKGALQIGGRRAALGDLRTRAIAVVNSVGRVVPPSSMLEGFAAAPRLRLELLEYHWQRGPMLQHVGPLVAPAAHVLLWPKILDWAQTTASLRREERRMRRLSARAAALQPAGTM
jgi:polyhydroxyalkanoate synthase